MEKFRSDNELETLHKSLAFLWQDHGCHIEYLASGYGAQPRGLLGWLGGNVYQGDKDRNTDWETLIRSLRLPMDELLDLLKGPKEAEDKLKQIRNTIENTQQNQTSPHGGKQ